MRTFDVVVIGGGPAGEEASARLADRGLAVALVEDRLVGGECAHWACIPSKALLRPYEALAEARRLPGALEAAAGDLAVRSVLRRRDEVIGVDEATGRPGDARQLAWIAGHHVTLVRGRGRLTGERRVAVGDEELEARRAVVLAGGSEPLLPQIEGLDGRDEGVWTNREATTAQEIPRRMVVVGGGPVGVEMAQAFQTFGSRVTIVEGAQRILPGEEEWASLQLAEALQRYGVDIRTGESAVRVSRSDGAIAVAISGGATVEGDVVLVTLGRRPPTADVGMDRVGLEPGRFVDVDANMQVPGLPWLYAVGDINGRAPLTHMGKYQARLAADAILGRADAIAHGADGPLAPHVTFTDPQVARVGHTTETAREAGIAIDVHDTDPSGGNDGGLFYAPGAPGRARFLIDAARGVIVGFTITGSEVTDFLHAATIAVVGEVPLERLRHAVPPFPTRSELWLSLFEHAGVRGRWSGS